MVHTASSITHSMDPEHGALCTRAGGCNDVNRLRVLAARGQAHRPSARACCPGHRTAAAVMGLNTQSYTTVVAIVGTGPLTQTFTARSRPGHACVCVSPQELSQAFIRAYFFSLNYRSFGACCGDGSHLCRYFVIANAVACAYNLAVLLTRRLVLQRRAASLAVRMLDMVSSGS
jgi:hypothetical protein